jgi:Ternary complex associated domain 9/Uncharacterised protein family (UPF0158)
VELKSLCLAAGRRNEIGDLLRGIVDLDGQGYPDPSRNWQAGVSLVDITRMLQGGRSDAAVYEMTVHRPGRPARRHVLKVGPLAEIVAEWRAYRTWLADTSSATVTPVEAVSRTVSETAVDLDDLDLVRIDPLPSWVWYQDMADFAETLADERAGRGLTRAIQGKGAFRRFKDELHEEYPDLLPAWYAFRDARTKRRAVQWLADNSLIDDDAASRFLTGHPDPDLPGAT